MGEVESWLGGQSWGDLMALLRMVAALPVEDALRRAVEREVSERTMVEFCVWPARPEDQWEET